MNIEKFLKEYSPADVDLDLDFLARIIQDYINPESSIDASSLKETAKNYLLMQKSLQEQLTKIGYEF